MIHFNRKKWERVKTDTELWWEGKLDRPLIQIRLSGYEKDPAKTAGPYHQFAANYNKNTTAEEIVDIWDYHLSEYRFLGDAFPQIWPNFGPGILAGFIGAEVSCREDTVWFSPKGDHIPYSFSSKMEHDNYWFSRIRDIYAAAEKKWQGNVLLGMTDLGGGMDVLAGLESTESLLLDLYDNPEKVIESRDRLTEIWFEYFSALNSCIPKNQGYSCWTPLLSEKSFYMLQCDFCAMLSPDFFNRFVLPELKNLGSRLERPFYHLDGPGELPHLDSLLGWDRLKGIQWIPGAGQPDMSRWPDVYRKISEAGKKIQIFGFDCSAGRPLLEVIAEQTGNPSCMAAIIDLPKEREDEALRLLDAFGCPF